MAAWLYVEQPPIPDVVVVMEDEPLLPNVSRGLDLEGPFWSSSRRPGHKRCHGGGQAVESSPSARSASPHSRLLSAASDEVLGILVAAGQVQALSLLVDRHFDALRGCAQGILHDALLSEDVALEVFEWVWEHRRDWHPRNVRAFPREQGPKRGSEPAQEPPIGETARADLCDSLLPSGNARRRPRAGGACHPRAQGDRLSPPATADGCGSQDTRRPFLQGDRRTHGYLHQDVEHHVEAGLAKLRQLLAADSEDWRVRRIARDGGEG